jgi:hypothetical protein
MTRARVAAFSAAVVLAMSVAAQAVRPTVWGQSSEAQFAKGKLAGTVTTSLGEVRLGRKLTVLLPGEHAPAVVSCVASAGKTLYFGAGNEGAVYAIAADKPEKTARKFAELPGAMVSCLVWTGKDLLAGAGGGDKAGVYRVDGQGKVAPVWTDAGVKYVWALVEGEAGTWYAATGPEAKVYAIDKAGKGSVIYEAGAKLAKNILCLAAGGGKLYAGTDDSGLVVEIDPKAKTSRILLDSQEKEVSALVVSDSGGVWAATADASKAAPDGAPASDEERKGKAGGAATGPAATPPTSVPASRPAAGSAAAPATKPSQDGAAGPGDAPARATPRDVMAKLDALLESIQDKSSTTAPAAPNPASTTAPAAPPAPTPAPPAAPKPILIIPARTIAPSATGGPPALAAGPIVQGNAVYYIRPDGLVDTIFRRPVTILSMLRTDKHLLLGTGNGGVLYSVSLDGDEVSMLADTDAKQITALAAGEAGQVFLGTANQGSVARLEKDLVAAGTYDSETLDARQLARWGTMQASAVLAGGKVAVATRSGNVAEPDDKTWSSWSKEMPLDGGFLSVGSPAGRFLQYRLSFAGDGRTSPSVRAVRVIYQPGNLPPTVASVDVTAVQKGERGPAGEPVAPTLAFRLLTIKAADENGDALKFTIAFRELGSDKWITLTDKLMAPQFVWDTRAVPDATYELRVTASDEPANPLASALTATRVTEPVLVDNTPPAIADLQAKMAATKATVTGRATDSGSRVASIHYSVDSQEEWVEVPSSDGICDSDSEKFSFEVKDLKPGPHRIAVRVTDEFLNVGYASANVEAR